VSRLALQKGFSDQQLEAMKAYWLRRLKDRLRKPMDRVRLHDIETMHRSRVARCFQKKRFLFQLWFNTLGPGPRPGSATATSASATTPSVSAGDHNGPRSHRGRRGCLFDVRSCGDRRPLTGAGTRRGLAGWSHAHRAARRLSRFVLRMASPTGQVTG